MKVYMNNTFSGYYPVGSAAVVVAENRQSAAALLSEILKRVDLSQEVAPESMMEVDLNKTNAYLLAVGEY